MPEEPATFELREPASPDALLPPDPLPPWLLALAIVALAAAVAGVWLWLRHRRRRAASPEVLRENAFRQARAALDAVATPHARAAAVQVSLILRRYLATAANDPSLYETHEEFISRANALGTLTDQARAACHDGFTRLAAIKYSPAEGPDAAAASASAAGVVGGAGELLTTLHQGFRN